jgi:putative transposase
MVPFPWQAPGLTSARGERFATPDTILRWHRDLLRRRHAEASRPQRPGRPPTIRSIQALVLRLVRENTNWGYRRVHGELHTPGIKVAPSTVWEILKTNGIEPAPHRDHLTWTTFLRSQAQAILAADFFDRAPPALTARNLDRTVEN